MSDLRHAMMEKFRKMKARQKEARDAAQNRRDSEGKDSSSARQKRKEGSKREKKKKDGEETLSKKERRKKKEKEEKEESNSSIFSLISKRERKKKKGNVESKSKREKKKTARKKAEEETSTRAKKGRARDFPVTDAQKENYVNFLMEVFGLGVDGLIQQYQIHLKTFVPPNFSHTAFDKNMNKNRYKDVVCIDETRVVLQDKDPDYIHANHVKGEPFLNPFICTQGPMSITVNDFWAMVMQEKVCNIIMLCNIVETGKNKCFQYWPQEVGSSLTFGDVQVRNAEVDENKDTTFVLSILEAESGGNRLVIKHMRWRNWPDKGIPSSVMAPFRILKLARQQSHRPTIVHCSAGIGRTGCIVAIEMGLQQILSGKPLSIIQMVKQLRGMRMSTIQTDEQLVYVVRCLVAYAEVCGIFNSRPELQEKADKFISDYDAMLTMKRPAVTPTPAATTPIATTPTATTPAMDIAIAPTTPPAPTALPMAQPPSGPMLPPAADAPIYTVLAKPGDEQTTPKADNILQIPVEKQEEQPQKTKQPVQQPLKPIAPALMFEPPQKVEPLPKPEAAPKLEPSKPAEQQLLKPVQLKQLSQKDEQQQKPAQSLPKSQKSEPTMQQKQQGPNSQTTAQPIQVPWKPVEPQMKPVQLPQSTKPPQLQLKPVPANLVSLQPPKPAPQLPPKPAQQLPPKAAPQLMAKPASQLPPKPTPQLPLKPAPQFPPKLAQSPQSPVNPTQPAQSPIPTSPLAPTQTSPIKSSPLAAQVPQQNQMPTQSAQKPAPYVTPGVPVKKLGQSQQFTEDKSQNEKK